MEISNKTLDNVVYQKFDAVGKVIGEYIVCKDSKKMKKKSKSKNL